MTTGETAGAGPSARPPELQYDERGLVPAVVQDVTDGRVLMLAWMDSEALGATLATREVHFHSRSRDRLWRKGETSGNVLRLVEITADCDSDALLLTVDPVGPTCHRGTRSCFDPDGSPAEPAEPAEPTTPTEPTTPAEQAEPAEQGLAWLESLWSTIASRAAGRPEGSYTARLLDGGVDMVARKLTEEATEVLIAAKDDATAQASGDDRGATRDALVGETADLVYHALVLLAERGLDPFAVVTRLRDRHRG